MAPIQFWSRWLGKLRYKLKINQCKIKIAEKRQVLSLDLKIQDLSCHSDKLTPHSGAETGKAPDSQDFRLKLTRFMIRCSAEDGREFWTASNELSNLKCKQETVGVKL